MSTPKDTLNRLLELVQLIPPYPRSISTTELIGLLEARKGYLVDPRTIQRDLKRLEEVFSLVCDDSERPHRWSLNSKLNVQHLDTPTAYKARIASLHLKIHILRRCIHANGLNHRRVYKNIHPDIFPLDYHLRLN